MKKRIGIVTIFDMYNKGNRLQNYAVHHVLTNMGYECETLVLADLFPSPIIRLKLFFKSILCTLVKNNLVERKPDAVRRYNIDQFNKNIKFKKVEAENGHFPKSLATNYDYFFTGSDQVWNPYFWKTNSGSEEAGFNNFFLRFAKPSQRKCFSPSIGISEIPKDWQPQFAEILKTYSHIGIREEAGVDIVKKLAEREDAIVTLDPTLMLNKEEWEKVERKADYHPKEKYILLALLGKASEEISVEKREMLNDLARKRGLKVVQLGIRIRPKIFVAAPGEFISLFRNAELICTDSYHSIIFSFIFNKPFLLFNRDLKKYNIDMSSRIKTLLKLLGLERKAIENQVWDEEHIFECDYANSYARLKQEQKKTLKFLEESLK